MILWMVSIAVGVSLLVISAAVTAANPGMASAHLFVVGLITTAIALIAVGDTRKLIKGGASQMRIAGGLMRYMGLIWAWGALVLHITYGTQILQWAGWWQYFIAFIVLAGLCLYVSRLLCEADKVGELDEHILKISRYIAGVTLFAVFISACVFGFGRLASVPVSQADVWAAQNLFVFGAIALAAVSTYLLKASINEAD